MGVNHVVYKLIIFYTVFTKLQVAFYRFKKFKMFFEIWPVKVNRSKFLMGGAKYNCEYLEITKNLSPPSFSENVPNIIRKKTLLVNFNNSKQ